jgi:hypothetical protein
MPELSPLFIYLFVATAFFAAIAPRQSLFFHPTWDDWFGCFVLSSIWPWTLLVKIIKALTGE